MSKFYKNLFQNPFFRYNIDNMDENRLLKIAIFTDTYRPVINGVVTSIDNLALSLAEKGHKIIIVAPNTKKSVEPLHNNITIKRIASIQANFYEDFCWTQPFSFRLYKYLKDENIDLIHIMTPFTVCYLGIKFAKLLNLPSVGTFHTFITDPTYYEHMFGKMFELRKETVWYYTNLYYNAVDISTAPSPSTRESMIRNKCTTDIKVISNGIRPESFDNSNWKEFKAKWKLNDKVILYYGRIANEKNLNHLIDSFESLYKKDKDVQLLIIGAGPQLDELKEYVNSKNLTQNVVFTGFIKNDELIRSGVYKASTIFATAALTENQPMTILEAQCNGMVCVGPDARGVPDLIINGVNGIVVDPYNKEEMADAFFSLLNDLPLREKMSLKVNELIQEHYLPNVIVTWEQTYHKLLDDFSNGKLEKKDYVHMKTILAISKQIKLTFFKK